jgi:hypothetical protein
VDDSVDEDGFQQFVDNELGEGFRAIFDGGLGAVVAARLAAGRFLDGLAAVRPPGARDVLGDVVLVVSELVTNAVKFAPGPITLGLRLTVAGVHVVVGDTSTVLPFAREVGAVGEGGLGPMIDKLADQVNVLTKVGGKDVHVFMPW